MENDNKILKQMSKDFLVLQQINDLFKNPNIAGVKLDKFNISEKSELLFQYIQKRKDLDLVSGQIIRVNKLDLLKQKLAYKLEVFENEKKKLISQQKYIEHLENEIAEINLELQEMVREDEDENKPNN